MAGMGNRLGEKWKVPDARWEGSRVLGGPEFSTLSSLSNPTSSLLEGLPCLTGSFGLVLLIVWGEGNGEGRGTWT